MMLELDHGVRCERHAGEAFAPRCYDCQTLNASPIAPINRQGMCSRHDGYPSSDRFPCARCLRDAEDTTDD